MGSIYRPSYWDRRGNRRESAMWWIQYCTAGRRAYFSAGMALGALALAEARTRK